MTNRPPQLARFEGATGVVDSSAGAGRRALVIGLFAIQVVVGLGCGDPAPNRSVAQFEDTGNEPLVGSAAIVESHIDTLGVWPEPAKTGSFDDYFRFVGRIQLSDSVHIGSIRSIEISSAGRLLVQEVGSPPRLFLFEPTGEFVRELRPDNCVPDFELLPARARFFLEDDVIVANSGSRGGFRFDRDGRCLGRIEIGLALPMGLGTGSGRTVHLLRTDHDGLYLESIETNGGGSKKHSIATDFINLVTYVPISDVVVDPRGSVYVALPYLPTVLALRPGSDSFVSLGSAPNYFRPLPEDFQGNMQDLSNLMSEVDRLMYSSSYTEGIRMLDADVLLLTYRNGFENTMESPRAFGYQLIHSSGSVVNSAPVYLPSVYGESSVLGARDGLIYRLVESPVFENGEVANANPSLAVYRLTRSLKSELQS